MEANKIHENSKVEEYCSKVISHKRRSDKTKCDILLELDANMHTNLGTDSLKGERDLVKKNSLTIYRHIKKIDWTLGCALLLSMGKLK